LRRRARASSAKRAELSRVPIDTTAAADSSPPAFALFALGFRPFFLVAALAAVGLMGLWLADYGGAFTFRNYYGGTYWHAHEMVFGYAAAVVAGFLLTAVRNWTSIDTPRGASLAALIVSWLAGRAAPFASGVLPGWLIAAVDTSFLPVLAVSLAVPLLRRRQWRNIAFVPILLVLAAANVLVHLDVLGVLPGRAATGLYLGVDLIVLLIAVVGGRVIPFFTQRALANARPRVWKPVEWVSIGSIITFAALAVAAATPRLIVVVAIVAAFAHAVRLWGWSDRRMWSVPLLWVLYAGYGWLVIGFAAEAISLAGMARPQLALHAFTAGAIGVLTLGMMGRVSLGHTGRPLHAAPPLVGAFFLVNAAAVLRVLGGWWVPDEWYVSMIMAAGAAWIAAFVLFLAVYAPILVRPRIDGREG